MTITEEQIQNLYKFTRQHYVYWYDLQSELVDHLANDIEQIWTTEPNLTFEQAKLKSFKKFGVFGFMDVVEKKQKALSKRYFKLFWQAFKGFFTIPKILLTISLFFAVLFFIRLVHHNNIVIMSISISVVLFPLIYLFRNGAKMKRKIKQNPKNKRFMFEDYIMNLGSLGGFVSLPLHLLNPLVDKDIWTYNMELFFTSFIVIFGLSLYILVYIIPPKVRAIIAKEHPEYKLT